VALPHHAAHVDVIGNHNGRPTRAGIPKPPKSATSAINKTVGEATTFSQFLPTHTVRLEYGQMNEVNVLIV
jgi:hypothetical protein